jgi:hypothetical protein
MLSKEAVVGVVAIPRELFVSGLDLCTCADPITVEVMKVEAAPVSMDSILAAHLFTNSTLRKWFR